MSELRKGKRTYMLVMGFILTIFLLVLDISKRYETKINIHFENYQKKSRGKCENCVWDKSFKVIYEGGRALPPGMLENITVLNESQCNSKNFLIFKCDSSVVCGGWADRQKGIVSTFLMALLTNRKFVIDMTSPCKLEEFLLENVYNWSLCKGYLRNVPNAYASSFMYVDKYNFSKEIEQYDFERHWTRKVIVLRFNSYAIDGIRQHKKAKSRLKWLLRMTNEEVIHIVLNTLFKPNNRLLYEANYFYDNNINERKLICCHIRNGKNPSIPDDAKPRFGSPNETVIFEYLKKYDKSSEYVIYIASDSEKVKESANRKLTSYISINSRIVHVDRLGKYKKHKAEACEGFYAVVLEQLILSLCDTLILTHSGFGTMAAYMRGISHNLYMYHPKTRRIVGTNLTDIQTIFEFI